MKAESLQEVWKHRQAHFHAHRQDDIFTQSASPEFHLTRSSSTARGLARPDQLAAKHIPVVAGPMIGTRTSRLANMDDCNPAELAEAGIPVAICTDHPSAERFLALSAGIAVRGGMSREDALAQSRSFRRDLRIADRVGSSSG
jgi:imidazolonepropionase-like amidohydrolase